MRPSSGIAYGVLVEGRLPADFAPFLRPAGGAPPRRRLLASYRTIPELPAVDEIWAAEPEPPRWRDRLALFRTADGFGLTVESEGSGLFRIAPGGIAVDWLPGGAGAPHFFFSYALPLWLEARGVTVLHAGAVARGGRAAAFVGPSGIGKSTLCAELVAAGWSFVADDGLALDEDAGGAWRCLPGPPWLRLWPSALEGRLGRVAEELPRVHAAVEKRRLPVGGEPAGGDETTELAAVYVLDRRPPGDGPVAVERLPPRQGLLGLVEHSLAAAPLAALGLAAARLDRLARAAEGVPVRRLRYPSGDTAPVAAAIARDLDALHLPA